MQVSIAEVLERLKAQPAADRAASVQHAKDHTAHMRFVPLPGPQTDAYLSRADVLLYGGQAGGGKGLRPDCPVLTPFGWRKIGALEVGAALCATDGTVQKVIAKYERGEQPLYRLRWSDGNETVCDQDHIWLMWESRGSRKIAGKPTCGEAGARKFTTREIAERYQKPDRQRLGIPVMSAPALFNVHGENKGTNKHISRVIPPYVLGALIGDGHLSPKSVSLSSADPELVERFQAGLDCMAGEAVQLGISHRSGTECKEYRIPNAVLHAHLEDIGLMGARSEEKFIPRIYLLAPPEERWALLRGLMDTDGWCEEDGHCFYGTSSRRLADDVTHLARSLGAIASRTEKTPTYSHNGEKKLGLLAHSIKIKMRDPARMFALQRKVDRCSDKEYQSLGIWLESIEPAGRGETVCIAVSHPNSLFVIDGFIVTHNTYLAVGLTQEHTRSIIFRRESSQTDGLEEAGKQLIGDAARFNGTDKEWTWLDGSGRSVKLAGLQQVDDWIKHAGRERDFLGFDEAGEFARDQVSSLLAWNRGPAGQRCRIVLLSNPPRTSEGVWMMEWFAPWLDIAHPNPAKPGELRWACMHKGSPVWQAGPGTYDMDGEPNIAMSFTFIPASLSDNPHRDTPEYRARLQSLPEPLRSQLLKGIFGLGGDDDPWQVIPTQWVLEAQNRWTEKPPKGVPMCCIAADVAQGGPDNTVLAVRYDAWFDKLQVVPGTQTPGGTDVAGLVVSKRRDNALVVIDIGGGWGGDAYAHLKANDVETMGYMGVKESTRRTQDNQLRFFNIRTEVYWKLREALNPDQIGGSPVMLPPDRILLADLCSPKYEVTPRGIKIEAKVDLVKRLKRSPDRGDAVAMCHWAGPRAATHLRSWEQGNIGRKRPLQSRAIMGR